MFIADRLIKLRQSKKLTQKDVASNIGIARTTYVRYEKGEIQPPSDMLVRISKFFEVSIDYLLGNTNDPTPQNEKSLVYDDEAWELMREMYERPELRALFKTSKKVKPEDIKAVDELLKHMAEESGF